MKTIKDNSILLTYEWIFGMDGDGFDFGGIFEDVNDLRSHINSICTEVKEIELNNGNIHAFRVRHPKFGYVLAVANNINYVSEKK